MNNQPLKLTNKSVWMQHLDVHYAIINYTKDRETALLVPSWSKDRATTGDRYWRIQNAQGFQYMIKRTAYFKFPINIYYSVGEYRNGIPKSDKQYNSVVPELEEFKKEPWKHQTKYDFVIDIDAHGEEDEFELAKIQTIRIRDHFKRKKIPHEVRFTGNGYHIVIKYEDYQTAREFSFNPNDERNIYREYAEYAKFLKQNNSLVDISIYDHRRVIKLPFSVVCNQDEDYVCLPLINKELEMLNKSDFKLKNCMHLLNDRKLNWRIVKAEEGRFLR